MKPPRHRSQWSDLAQHLGLEGMNDEALAEAARLAAQPPAERAPEKSASPAPVEDVEDADVRYSEEVARDVQAAAGAEPELVLPEPPKSSRWSSLASALGLRWRDKEPAAPSAPQPVAKRPEPEAKRPEAQAKRPETKPEPRRETPAPEPPARREAPAPVEPAAEDEIGWGRPARRERKPEERETRPAPERSERESRPREERGEGRRGREEGSRREERPRREEERPRRDEGRAVSEAKAGALPPRGEPTGGFGGGLLDFEDAPPPSSAERETTGRHAFRSDEDVDTDEFADRTPAAERGEEGDRPRRRRRRRGRGGAEARDDDREPSRPLREEPISGALDDEEDVEVEADAEAAVLEEGESGEPSEMRRRRRRRRRGGSSSREEGAETSRREVSEARPAKPAPAARRDFDEDDEFEDDEEDESLDGSRIAAKGDADDEEDEPSESRSRRPRSRRRRSSSERTTGERTTSERAPSQREAAGEGTSRSSRSSRGEGRGEEPRRSDRGESRTREGAPARERVREEREPVASDRDDDLVEPLGVDPRFAKIPTWLYCVSSVIDGNLAKRGTSQESDRPRRSRRPPRRPTN